VWSHPNNEIRDSAKLHVIVPAGGAPFSIPATAALFDGGASMAPNTSFTIDGPAEYVGDASSVVKEPH
jgi:hypothetical protein